MMKIGVISIFLLLSAVAFGQGNIKNDELIESMDRGLIVYEDFCMSCHLADGKGVEKVTPPLALSDYLMKDRANSIKVVKFGQSGEITVNGQVYNGTMAPMGLTNKEIADVMNYITNNFGNKNDTLFTEEEVLKIEK